MIALCFLWLWVSLASWNPYCDCWEVRRFPCYAVLPHSPYTPCPVKGGQ